MNNPTLLLLPFPDERSLTGLSRAAAAARWNVERRAGGIFSPADRLRRDEIVLYGNWMMACAAAEMFGLALLAPTATWLPDLPQRYLQRELRTIAWEAARSRIEPFFLKPVIGKWNGPKVFGTGAELPVAESLPAGEPMLIGEPVQFEIEFRCFIQNRQVQTLSPYLRHGELCLRDGIWTAEDREFRAALEFANGLLADDNIPLPPACVLDVGLIAGRGWGVVEAQPCWFSYLYSCDPARVLSVLRRACVPLRHFTVEDERWQVRGQSLVAY